MGKEEKRLEMFSLVADRRSSGLMQKAFCELHRMKVATLGYGVVRSKEAGMQHGGFVGLSRDLVYGNSGGLFSFRVQDENRGSIPSKVKKSDSLYIMTGIF